MAAPDPRRVLVAMRGALLASLAFGTTGCALFEVFADPPPPWVTVRGERSVAPPTAPIQRILLLPLQTGDAIDAHAESLRAALAQVLRDSCGFDVVAPVPSALPRTTRDEVMIAAGSGGGADAARDVPALIRLHREWDADAVLFGKLAFSRPHTEPAVGVELALIDARDGARLWSAQDVVDARDPTVRA